MANIDVEGKIEARVCYNGKITPIVIFSFIVAAMGGVVFGYGMGISGGVTSMKPFLVQFFPDVYHKMKEDLNISNYCKFDSQILTAFTSSFYIAGLFTSLFASSVTRAFGRKQSILLGGAVSLTGVAIGGVATNVYILIIGRVMLGVGVGFTNQSVPLYLSEMSPPQYRGAIIYGFESSVTIGDLLATLINFGTQKIQSGLGWRISLSLAAAPALIQTLGALFIPETPNSIIQRHGDVGKAATMLQKIRGTTDIKMELDDLIAASVVSDKVNDHPFRRIVQRKYRPQLVMAFAISFFQQMTGMNVIIFYAPILFRTIGLGESASLLSTAATGIVGSICNLTAMVVVDRAGRRVLFMIGGVLMFLSQIIIGGIIVSQLGDHGGMSKGYGYLVFILILVFCAGFGWSWGPLTWLIPGEICPMEIRSAGQSISQAIAFLFIFIAAQTILSMLCQFKAWIFFFFGGWVVVMTGFVYLFLPETKNVPMEKMDLVWREHWFWKKIVLEVAEEKMGGENEEEGQR